MKKFASFLLCLLLLLGLGTGSAKSAGAEESTVGSAEDIWESYPSSEMFNNLWVGDIVIFKAHEYVDHEFEGTVGPSENESLTVLDGDCVEIDYFNRDGGFYAMGLKCVKPGTATVKVSVEDENGNAGEKTFSFTVAERPESQPVTVSTEFPSEIRLKIGDDASFLDGYQVVFKNLNFGLASDAKVLYNTDSSIGFGSIFGNFMIVGGGRGGFVSDYVSHERTAEPVSLYCRPEFHAHYAYKPGTITLQPSYRGEAVGSPYVIIIEEPVITTNAPETVTAGSTLNLDTALTNTSLENLKTADYDNPDNYGQDGWGNKYYLESSSQDNNRFIAYKPSVTIIEGADLVTQSNQDYSNTLTSSETLTFHKAGTVRLKVSYNQYITDEYNQLVHKLVTDPETGETHLEPTGEQYTYNPEKIITIQVTDDSVPSQPVITADETTGIKLEAEAGVVPPDTVLKVEQVKEGGNFVIINNALQTTSDKWVAYDISLLSNNAEIQPSGKVTVSIPRPRGLNMNKMVLYHVAEDGTLTQIPFTLDATKDNILFETDHFSLYAVVEAGNTTEQPSSSSSAAPGNDATVSTGVSSLPNNSATASEVVSSTPGNSAATSETASTAPSNDNVPKTGGDSHVLIFVVLILASACALLLVFITNKKHIRQAK